MKHLFIIALILSSCMKIKPKNSEEKVKTETVTAVPEVVEVQTYGLTAPSYEIAFREGKLNAYDIHLSFQNNWPKEITIVESTEKEKNSAEVSLDSNFHLTWPLKYPGEKVSLELYYKTPEGLTSLGLIKFESPIDHVLTGQLGEDSFKKFYNEKNRRYEIKGKRRIFFTDNLKLYTQGKNFLFEAERIVFINSQIRAFPEGQTAGPGQDGRSGGQLIFKSPNISGEGHFIITGEHGGVGQKGPDPIDSMRGRDGFIGADAVSEEMPKESGGYAPIPSPVVIHFYKMLVAPVRGSHGEEGKKGWPGYSGGRGGDSMIVRFESEDVSQLRVNISADRARGGQGGPGGDGGAGGAPGRNGRCKQQWMIDKEKAASPNPHWWPLQYKIQGCTEYADVYQAGRQGPPGDFGATGLSGVVHPVCYGIGAKLNCQSY